MMNDEIIKASLFKSHYEAAQQMPVEERCAFYDAMFRYQFTGEISDDLPPAIKWIMTAILPVLDKEIEGKGGRPECGVTAEEIAAKKEELGSAKAVAEHFGISERTVYAKLQTAKTAKTAKTKEERRMKNEECRKENEEREREREGAQGAPGGKPPAPPHSSSKTSVEFPTERARRTPPPTREEVRSLCKEMRYSFDPDTFFAYYMASGWYRSNGTKVDDWVYEAEIWEKRERKFAQAQARASPAYQTWRAEDAPKISEEERAAVTEGLGKIFGKLKQKTVMGG